MLGCRFSFKVYAKNVREKGTNLMLMDMCLPKFDIYQGTVPPNCFKSHTSSRCPVFFQNVLSEVWSKIHFVRRNIVSTGQTVQTYKIIFRPVCY